MKWLLSLSQSCSQFTSCCRNTQYTPIFAQFQCTHAEDEIDGSSKKRIIIYKFDRCRCDIVILLRCCSCRMLWPSHMCWWLCVRLFTHSTNHERHCMLLRTCVWRIQSDFAFQLLHLLFRSEFQCKISLWPSAKRIHMRLTSGVHRAEMYGAARAIYWAFTPSRQQCLALGALHRWPNTAHFQIHQSNK